MLLISVFVLLLLSAFFSGSETGFTAVNKARMHKLESEGNRRARMVKRLYEDKDRLIGTILLGNNAVNILSSALATTLALNLFGNEGVAYATIAMTLLVLIFAEVLPKTYAFRNSDKVAMAVAPIFILLMKLLYPLTALVQFIVNIFLKLFRMEKVEGIGLHGTDILRGAIEMHHQEGAVVKGERDMLGSILDLAELDVGEVMIHRKEMQIINADEPVEKIIEQAFGSPYSRIPVWQENPDNIIGILYNKDLVRSLMENPEVGQLDIRQVIKEPWFVPETTSLQDQLQAFRSKHNHFALVVDEYGGLLGMITLEDILEEIVGQIHDEYDVARRKIRQLPDGAYIVFGGMSIRDLNRELDWDLPDDEAATVAGLIIEEAEMIPNAGQNFHFHNYRFEILKKKQNQITRVKIWRD